MKKYVNPYAELLILEKEDVLTASTQPANNSDDDETPVLPFLRVGNV